MKIIVTAGGTGGHIYPALAIINKFKEHDKNTEVLYIGTHNRMEKDIVPATGIPYEALEIYGLSKTNLIRDVKNVFLINKAYKKCLALMKEFKPDVVIGVGGYVTYPVLKAAKKLKIKTFIHEQNTIPGKANLAISKYADIVGVSFEASKDKFHNKNIKFTGNPCGENAKNMENYDKTKLGFNKDKKLIVVVAGSLGSKTINNSMKNFISNCGKEPFEVLYITGNGLYNDFVNNLEIPSNVKVLPYFDNLPRILKSADCLVTRAGASTISEIIALHIPSILIPSPYVANNHQYYNALALENKNACLMIEEKNLDDTILKEKINAIIDDLKVRTAIIDNLKKLDNINSSETIYQIIKDMVINNESK
ncbi:MAG: undecaprenyldiphospho-muramoylpentapeptide beta-N-acetylglucosaminyltransferase [Bacilli bacterium]|nr:undecaprenyldiphospho-muramoylpentapeptide beta-N-acetylglucosaminyltransferase [Bacilli bacterium]